MSIRVMVVDDHPVYRGGLTGVLAEADDIDLVGEAASGAEALERVVGLRPDVVLMDLHMPEVSGIEATQRLRSEAPEVKVLVLTMLDDAESVLAAMRAGAQGYLVKGASGEQIVETVRSVAAGAAVFGTDVASGVLDVLATAGRGARAGRPFPMLTEREVEVLDLVAAGLPNHAIARRLVVSDKTVRNHVSNIFTKLQVTDRSVAIVRAREAGLGAASRADPPGSKAGPGSHASGTARVQDF
jgi:DNA-binding NarL/FixJ family response regulator